MNASEIACGGGAMPEAPSGPKKPPITTAPMARLLAHYHSQLGAYNDAIRRLMATASPAQSAQLADLLMEELPADYGDKPTLVELIRRQNLRLGRHIKARSHELLMARAKDADGNPKKDPYGRSVGLSYTEILEVLAEEFPEASTSPACLRWYVVHMRDDANKEGKPWPDLPQVRPRSPAKKRKEA